MATDHASGQPAEKRFREGAKSGLLGIVLNLLLFAAKYTAGLLTGSVSFRADAVNNLSDAASSLVTLLGFLLAGKKEDAEHPYGHERYEYIAGLFVSVLILSMALSLFRDSLRTLLHPEAVRFAPWTLPLLAAAIAVKLFLFAWNRREGLRLSSETLLAASKDSLMDAAATTLVLVSTLLSAWTRFRPDGIAGLFLSFLVFYAGFSSVRATLSPLIGTGPDEALTKFVTETILGTPGVLGMHDLLIHDYGPDRRYMSLHIEVDAGTSLRDAHLLADGLEEKFWENCGLDTTIHVDPVDLSDGRLCLVRTRLEEILAAYPDVRYHDLQVLGEEPQIRFDLAVPFGSGAGDASIEKGVLEKLQAAFPGAEIHTKLDHYK